MIVDVPRNRPDALPNPSTETLPLLLVHVPPPPSVSGVTEPRHTFADPAIGAGDVETETVIVAIQPVAKE